MNSNHNLKSRDSLDQASIFASAGEMQTVRELFSEHFFAYSIRQNDEYRKINGLQPIREEIAAMFREHRAHLDRSKSEADCKQHIIEPILAKLGFAFSLEGRTGELKPDYLLYTSAELRNQVLKTVDRHEDRYHHAVTLLEAKPFGVPLGNPLKDGSKLKFPHDQISEYLKRAYDEKGGSWFQWGILTNGKHWRLYNQKAHPSAYFEIDLEQAVADERVFKTFWFLFHVSAFIQNTEHATRLDRARADALQYKAHVEDDLKGRIYDILIDLANGFYHYCPEDLSCSRCI